MRVGDRIKQLRTELGISQTELAKKLKLKPATISHYENGRRFPDARILQKMADFFDVSVDYLLGRTNTRKQEVIAFHLVNGYEDLSPEDIKYIRGLIEHIRKKNRQKGN